MANQGFDPIKALNNFRDGLNRLIEDGVSVVSGSQLLPVDVFETETHIVVKAGPIVGVSPEAIDVSMVGETLTIRGEAKADVEVENNSYLRRERKFGAFTRSVGIPLPVKADQAAATYKDGVLTITLPKVEPSMPNAVPVEPDAPSAQGT